MKKIFTPPNICTFIRIAGTVCLFFTEPLSVAFFIVYSVCGVSDVVDGTLARLTGSESSFGAKLDSIADILFYGVMILRLFPLLCQTLNAPVWWLVAIAAAVRVCAYAVGAVKFKKFVSLHTLMNKLTGLVVVLVPFVLKAPFAFWYCFAVVLTALAASAEELLIHIFSSECHTGKGGLPGLISQRFERKRAENKKKETASKADEEEVSSN